MKNILTIIIVLFFSGGPSYAQITLAHSYGPANSPAEIVNLSLSGKKIMVMCPVHYTDSISSSPNADTINFYNLDYSFWKRIVCPMISGYNMYSNIVYYPSETLFNTDPLLEAAIVYSRTTTPGNENIYIINEAGTLVDSITNVRPGGSYYNGYMKVYEVDSLGVGFQAFVPTPTGLSIYNLPGTLPCNICGNGLGVARVEPKPAIKTDLMPNPSSSQVKITFTLPTGSTQGNLILYNTEGQKIKSFIIDNRFGFIMLDNSQLTSGVYYYNIEVNGVVSSTQKMVVIK